MKDSTVTPSPKIAVEYLYRLEEGMEYLSSPEYFRSDGEKVTTNGRLCFRANIMCLKPDARNCAVTVASVVDISE